METLLKKATEAMNVDGLDDETTRMVQRVVLLRVSTKHINLWMRQLEMKRREICELAALMKLETIKQEIQKEKSLERWAKICTNHFTKKVKKMLFGEINNMVLCGNEKQVTQWCRKNKVYDEITENEIEEIWRRENPGDEPIR